MSTSDWVGVAVSVAQSVVLATGAFFAWRAYDLSRRAAEREPRRRLLTDAIEELKTLGHQSEVITPGVGFRDGSQIVACQRRLAIALAFVPWARAQRAWTVTAIPAQEVNKDAIEFAAADLNHAMQRLDRGLLDGGGAVPVFDADSPPLPPAR